MYHNLSGGTPLQDVVSQGCVLLYWTWDELVSVRNASTIVQLQAT